MGETISVEYDPLLTVRDDCRGQASYRTSRILLQPSSETWPRSATDIEHTFCHELTHHILNKMFRDDLNGDEKFVDVFAGLLHQALVTMKYE